VIECLPPPACPAPPSSPDGRRRRPARAVAHLARDDRGTVAVEVAIVAPALIVLLVLVMLAARLSQADSEIQSAATAAARAASQQATPDGARAEASEVAEASLRDAGLSCSPSEVTVDTSTLLPGGSVSVTVRCTAQLSDMALLAVPSSRTFEHTATEVVDTYRGSGG
jgi:Flp pilus assembly protein TadG